LPEKDQLLPGTIIWVAPFYNRSGFGVGARTNVIALHKAGARVRVISVNQVEGGIDDCDLALIRSLESTPVIPPVTLIVSHVPSRRWLDIKLPEPSVRILATTVFDCCADGKSAPAEMLAVCRKMDQIWLHDAAERKLFIAAGFPPERVRYVCWPHHWLENPMLPPPCAETACAEKSFRFLNISLFLPRRRWETLIEAYLEEFKRTENVELYLKVNFPSWHQVPGKPRKDLLDLVAALRLKTGSEASIIIDEDLGTRTDIVSLIDSCNAYISTDTALTAPISEARVRRRMVIIPEGLLGKPAAWYVGIPVDPHAKRPLTPEMLCYQPNHKGASMPLLDVNAVRHAMRRAFDMPLSERTAMASRGVSLLSPSQAVPLMADAIKAAWQYKEALEVNKKEENHGGRIVWEGSQFVHHSLALVNRELCLALIAAGCELSLLPCERHVFGDEADPRFEKLSARFNKRFEQPADVHVRHRWPPDFTPPPDGHWVMIQPWEFGSLPVEWVRRISAGLDEVWVPSLYVRNCFITSGVPAERVFVVPNGVNIDLFNPAAPAYPLQTTKSFKFLFAGGTIPRKGIDILLGAYTRTFTSKDDVCLVVKDMGGESFYKGQTAREWIRRLQADARNPEIDYIERTLSDREMAGLYSACDCLVAPYRGEGFGLPIAEAMACGRPVIVTGHGAAMDFCDERSGYLIPAREVVLPEKRVGAYATVDFPRLAEPDQRRLAQLMQHVVSHRTEALEKGSWGAGWIRSNLTWRHSAERVEERIRALRSKPIIRRMPLANSISDQTGTSAAADEAPPNDCSSSGPCDGRARAIAESAAQPVCGATVSGGHPMTDVEAMYAAVQPLLHASRPEEAEQTLRNIVQAFPGVGRAHHDLASLLYRAGRKQSALRHYELAAAAAPEDPDCQKILADYYYVESARIEDALRLYRKVLQLRPDDVQTLMTVGNILASLQRFEEAGRYYSKVLEVDPMHPEAAENNRRLSGRTMRPPATAADAVALHAEAKELAEAGELSEACERLERLLARSPQSALAHNDLGVLEYRRGDPDSALRHYEEALRIEPDNLTFQKNLADFFFVEQGRIEDALQIYVKVLEAAPKDTETLTALGKICAMLRQNHDARVFFERALAFEPWNEEAREGLERIDLEASEAARPPEARELHAEALRLASEGDGGGALQLLGRLTESHPEFALGHNDLGVLAYRAGDKDKALKHYEHAVRLEPHDATFRKNLADCYWVGFGRAEDALRVYVDILTTHPEDIDTLMAIGKLCRSLDQTEDARVFFERVVAIEPSNAEALAQLEQAAAAVKAA
jgi:Flp pilus assembly protein TadD/glycosyltransferase involved in cell wall biosynthesis